MQKATQLKEKNLRPGPKEVQIVQTKTSKMRACRNLSNAKTPINLIKKSHLPETQKKH